MDQVIVRGAFSGSGYGYGYGSGYGSGSGDGDGYGYGYGYGDGYGDGDGYGYGYGDGYGYGYGDYWKAAIPYLTASWSPQQLQRLREVAASGAAIAYWCSDSTGRASNGGNNAPVQAGTVEEIKGPLRICSKNALHATEIPSKWKGERLWIVALHGEVMREGDKLGALKREILGECK